MTFRKRPQHNASDLGLATTVNKIQPTLRKL
jgi:hypothetical protein